MPAILALDMLKHCGMLLEFGRRAVKAGGMRETGALFAFGACLYLRAAQLTCKTPTRCSSIAHRFEDLVSRERLRLKSR